MHHSFPPMFLPLGTQDVSQTLIWSDNKKRYLYRMKNPTMASVGHTTRIAQKYKPISDGLGLTFFLAPQSRLGDKTLGVRIGCFFGVENGLRSSVLQKYFETKSATTSIYRTLADVHFPFFFFPPRSLFGVGVWRPSIKHTTLQEKKHRVFTGHDTTHPAGRVRRVSKIAGPLGRCSKSDGTGRVGRFSNLNGSGRVILDMSLGQIIDLTAVAHFQISNEKYKNTRILKYTKKYKKHKNTQKNTKNT